MYSEFLLALTVAQLAIDTGGNVILPLILIWNRSMRLVAVTGRANAAAIEMLIFAVILVQDRIAARTAG